MAWTCYICDHQGYVHQYWVPEIKRSILWCSECNADWDSWEDFFLRGKISGDEGVLRPLGLSDWQVTLEPIGNFWLFWYDKSNHSFQSKIKVNIPHADTQILLDMIKVKKVGPLYPYNGTYVIDQVRAQQLSGYFEQEPQFDFDKYYYFLEFDEEIGGQIEVEKNRPDYPSIFSKQIRLVFGEGG